MLRSSEFFAISIISSGIIGAGMFSLPFVFSKIGLILGFFLIVFLTIVMAIVHFLYGELLHINKESGFLNIIEKYLGKKYKILGGVAVIINMLLVLTIYLIFYKSFSSIFITSAVEDYIVLFLWFISSLIILLKINSIAHLESFFILMIIIVVSLLFFGSVYKFGLNANYISLVMNNDITFISAILLGLGPILFSLGGRASVESLVNYGRSIKLSLFSIKRTIIIGTSIPSFIYLLFVIAISQFSLGYPSEDSIYGLRNLSLIVNLISIIGILAVISTYVLIAISLEKILRRDLNFRSFYSNFIVIFAPLIIYILIKPSFLSLISATGGIFVSLEALLILRMSFLVNKKTNTKNKALLNNLKLNYFLSSFFLIVLVYTIVLVLPWKLIT